MGKTHAYAWEIMTQGEFDGLFDTSPQKIVEKTVRELNSEEIWTLCGLEKFGTLAPLLTSANSPQLVAGIVGNSHALEKLQRTTKSER